jgi:cation:H+ antiporter
MNGVLPLVGGLVALVLGAEVLVRAGTGLAVRFGVSPMVVGLTVVALGTSVPELAVGIDAARTGSPGLAVGNIVGTNLVNILLILGLSALLLPVVLDRATLRYDVPAMTGSALVLLVLAVDGVLRRVEGVLLLLLGLGYLVLRTWVSLREDAAPPAPSAPPEEREEPPAEQSETVRQGLYLLGALVVVVVGAELLVDGAVSSARALGVSDAVIGLTVVAVGTSAPELVTTVVSTVRGDRDLAIGNLVGSSVLNLTVILGVTVTVAPYGVPVPDDVLAADLVLLVVVALVAVPVLVSGRRMTRVEGGLFVGSYLGYLAWLLLARS